MKQIEFERWEPDAENPRRLTYAGQRTAEDVFHELEAQLDSVGYLPDEYFTMDWRWEHGRQIPKGADFFCKTDYGGSESLSWTSIWNGRRAASPKKCFITGKTLGESGADLDRMFLISLRSRKRSRRQQCHAFMVVEGSQVQTMSLNLSPDEQRLVTEALAEQHIRLGLQAEGEEKLLRRMTGNVTEYMDAATVNRLDEHDRDLLAQHDGSRKLRRSWAGCSYEYERNSRACCRHAAD